MDTHRNGNFHMEMIRSRLVICICILFGVIYLTPMPVEASETDPGDITLVYVGKGNNVGFAAPTITSISRHNPTADTTDADQVVFRVTFDQAVLNVSTDDFAINGTAAGDGTVSSVSAVSTSVYDVTITGLTSSRGTINLDIKGNGGASGSNDITSDDGQLDAQSLADAQLTSSTEFGQSFKPTVSGSLTSIVLKNFAGSHSYNGSGTLELRLGAGLSGTVLATQSIDITSAAGEKTYTFSTPASVTSGTTYTFRVNMPGASNTAFSAQTGNPYANGDIYQPGLLSGADLFFKIFISDGSAEALSTTAPGTDQTYTIINLPTATNVNFSGILGPGQQLTGSYTFTDPDGDAESGTTYRWLRSDDASGTNKAAIAGATNTTYTLTNADAGKFISFEVTPSDGTDTGNATESTLQGPVFTETSDRNAMQFDGINDRITISDNAAFDFSSGFTAQLWVNPSSIKTQTVLAQYSSGQRAFAVILLSDGKVEFTVSTNGSGENFFTSAGSVSANTWTHLTLTYDGTTMRTYINGTADANTNAVSGTMFNSTAPVEIGARDGGVIYGGLIDEVRLWNRALSASEISARFNCRVPAETSNLIAYYDFNQGTTGLNNNSQSNLLDRSGNGLNGSFVNIALSGNTSNFLVGAQQGSFDGSDICAISPNDLSITGNEGWRMFSAPVNNLSYGTMLNSLWTQGFTGADTPTGTSNVYTWNEQTRQFVSISNSTDIPAAGTGFIVYVFSDNNNDGSPDGFPKSITNTSAQREGTVNPTLTFTDSGTPANDGWNLLGVPYGTTIDWDAGNGWTRTNLDGTFYVWSDSASSGAGAYLTWNGTTGTLANGRIAPWQGFWVKANAASPAITFTDTVRSSGSTLFKRKPVSQLKFNLLNSEKNMSSSTILLLHEEGTVEKDPLDAYKLQSLNSEYLSLHTLLDSETGLDINAIPTDLDEILEVDMDIAGSNMGGDYTLNWSPSFIPDGMRFVLLDHVNREEIKLESQSTYTFQIKRTQAEKAGRKEVNVSFDTPGHPVLSPRVLKSKQSAGPRFTLRIIPNGVQVSTEEPSELPNEVTLDQNFPNPFNPTTNISFTLPQAGEVRLQVFDLLGREVSTLVNSRQSAGAHTVTFDASSLSSGVYIYRLQVSGVVLTRKLTLIK